MELPQVSIYFRFSSEIFNRTTSQICSRWYLPMFLFRDGLLTLIYRASFMVLMRFWSSLPSMEKLSIMTAWPEMLRWSCIGEGAFRCSLNLSKISWFFLSAYYHLLNLLNSIYFTHACLCIFLILGFCTSISRICFFCLFANIFSPSKK